MLLKEAEGLVEMGFLMFSALHWKVPVGLENFLKITFII
jgi:hypothetical protein